MPGMEEFSLEKYWVSEKDFLKKKLEIRCKLDLYLWLLKRVWNEKKLLKVSLDLVILDLGELRSIPFMPERSTPLDLQLCKNVYKLLLFYFYISALCG